MKVSQKLAISFSVVLITAVIVGLIGIAGMREMRESVVFMYENRVRGIEYVHDMQNSFNEMRVECRNTVINSFYDDKKGAQDNHAAFLLHAGSFLASLEKCREVADSEELLIFYDKIHDLFAESYFPTTLALNERSIKDIPDHHNRLYINAQLATVGTIAAQIESMLLGLLELNSALAQQAGIDSTWLAQQYAILLFSLILAVAVIVFVIAYLIIKSIAVPINESAGVLMEIAQGNLDVRVKGDYKDEFKTIKHSVNYAAEQLSNYLDEKIRIERDSYQAQLARGKAEAVANAMRESISYASKIQRNLLPPDNDAASLFSDYSAIWEPRDVVSGDIYWIRQFDKGTVVCVCDCTGHGTPGALLTMLVVSALDGLVWPSNCDNPAWIMQRLDSKLSMVLHHTDADHDGRRAITDIDDGCDIAVLFIAGDGSVRFSSARIPVFVCDGNEVAHYKGQKLFVGEGKIKDRNDVAVHIIPAGRNNKFYVASDGLFDQIGSGHGRRFGYDTFKQVILDSHDEKMPVITGKVLDAFERHRGGQTRRDDIELIGFAPFTGGN